MLLQTLLLVRLLPVNRIHRNAIMIIQGGINRLHSIDGHVDVNQTKSQAICAAHQTRHYVIKPYISQIWQRDIIDGFAYCDFFRDMIGIYLDLVWYYFCLISEYYMDPFMGWRILQAVQMLSAIKTKIFLFFAFKYRVMSK